jgi:RHS repeat-associated protein
MRHVGSDPANPGWTRAFAYDEASQLEAGQRSNRLTRTTVGETTESFSAAGDGYDPHGNMLRMPQLQVVQWDFRDQLRMTQRQAVSPADVDGVARQGERTWYVYDAGGRRVRKVTELARGQIKDERLYLGNLEVYRRHGVDAIVRETLHVMDGAHRVALVETRTAGDEPGVPPRLVRYQFDNHLGSATLELDEQARVVSYEEYAPYGSTTYQAACAQTETRKRYRFTGKERDEESGFYYHGARYYAPWIARWTSCDPAELADGLNLYAYAGASPLRFNDPTGKQAVAPKEPPKYGDIQPGNQRTLALRDPAGNRISEREHIVARILLWLETYDPEAKTSAYEKSNYRASPTLLLPTDMARIKTGMDMKLRDQLKDALARGEVEYSVLNQITIEAAIERTIEARKAAIRRRQSAGITDLADLLAVTDDKIATAAHYQMGEVHKGGKQQDYDAILGGITQEELHKGVDALHEQAPTSTPTWKEFNDALDLVVLVYKLTRPFFQHPPQDPPSSGVGLGYRPRLATEPPKKRVSAATEEEEHAAEEEVEEEEADKREQEKKKSEGSLRYYGKKVAVPALVGGALLVGTLLFLEGNPNGFRQALQVMPAR